jgi:hypothetical protein
MNRWGGCCKLSAADWRFSSFEPTASGLINNKNNPID